MGFALLLSYMVLLGFGTMVSPGVGFFGGIITMLPQCVTESSHVPAYGILTWLLSTGLHRLGWPLSYALFVAGTGAMVFGLWMEIVQGSVPGRVVSLEDAIANGVGIGMAVVLMLWEKCRCNLLYRLPKQGI
jgi:VanZ family protein